MGYNKLNHVFLIIDGNRRYAKKIQIPFEESYRLGAEKVTQAIKWILKDNDADHLTIFGLALSNLMGRQASEIRPVLDSQEKTFRSWLDDDFLKNIRINFIGKIKDDAFMKKVTGFSFPESYVNACRALEEKTSKNSGKTLNILIAYGGSVDALDAQKRFALHALEKRKNIADSINLEIAPSFDFYDHTGPEIDLIIRTSETRPLSDGPAHLCYFSEFVSINKFWPEIEKEDIDEAISIFYNKDRRRGS